ncbi:maleate cis-trans isomerase [Streptomyces sp. SID10853]|uniref:maleate cis-trans isomerase family protein n=1 Tax=Streptomyces sp. SID10853 TaxID=2706028 RepID=UPI0013BF5456|nr:maleate cis-trans isomerase [Streptomyces sp. SID10853]NDZ81018.1 maleate cis-trans isomerase [Streptomyces sp. SID10853]
MPSTPPPMDGWDASTRIGVVVPHADVGPEAELQAIAPPSVSIHGSRIHFAAMRAGGEMDEKIPHDPVRAFVEAPYLDQAVELLAASPLHALTLGFTSSSYALKAEGEADLYERLLPVTRGLPVTGTTKAARAAFDSLGARRIAVVNPPWFDDTLSGQGADYFAEFGYDVVHHAPCGLPSDQKAITPDNLSAWIRTTVAAHRPEAVLVAGNGIRAVGTIQALEGELGFHVLTANQVILWHALHLAGAAGTAHSITDYGQLFATDPRDDHT